MLLFVQTHWTNCVCVVNEPQVFDELRALRVARLFVVLRVVIVVKIEINGHDGRGFLRSLLRMETQQSLLHVYRCTRLLLPSDLFYDVFKLRHFDLCDNVFKALHRQIIEHHVGVFLSVYNLLGQQKRDRDILNVFSARGFPLCDVFYFRYNGSD